MTIIRGFVNNPPLSLDQTNAIVTDPITENELVTMDYRIQTQGIHRDVESKVLTIHHDRYPLRRVDGCKIPAAQARAVTQRSFVPVQLGTERNWCSDAFEKTVLSLLTANNLRKSDLEAGSVNLMMLLAAMAVDENRKHLELLAWFANTTNANPEFNQLKGYWELIQEAVGQNLTPHLATYSGAPLGSGDAIALLRNLIKIQSNELYNLSKMDKVIYIGRGIDEQLKADVDSGLFGSATYQSRIEGDREVMRFDGIEIRVKSEWDELGVSEMGFAADANLAVLTMKRNLVWGINDRDAVYEQFYDQKDMEYTMRSMITFGVQIDHPGMMAVAY